MSGKWDCKLKPVGLLHTEKIVETVLLYVFKIAITASFLTNPVTDFWRLHFNLVLGKKRIADNPSLNRRSYEVIRPESASSPVISTKKGRE